MSLVLKCHIKDVTGLVLSAFAASGSRIEVSIS
jgi:hypothetical protein